VGGKRNPLNIAALQHSWRALIRSISSEIWRTLYVIALLLRIGSAHQADLFPLQVIDPDQFPFADVHAGWVGMKDDADTLHARLERLSELVRHAAPED
jgi:hypothetical protein